MSNQNNNDLLLFAARDGNVAEVRRLLPISDPKAYSSEALRLAAQYGRTECVKLLIPVSNPKIQGSYALKIAADYGHTQCVELLIPVSDPKADKSQALQWAVAKRHTQCAELLYPVSELAVALKHLEQDYPDHYDIWGQLYEMIEAERLRNNLILEVKNTASVKVQRKV